MAADSISWHVIITAPHAGAHDAAQPVIVTAAQPLSVCMHAIAGGAPAPTDRAVRPAVQPGGAGHMRRARLHAQHGAGGKRNIAWRPISNAGTSAPWPSPSLHVCIFMLINV
jgi:hypothetical protein